MNEFTVEKPKGLFDLSAILQNHVTPDTRPSFALYSSLASAAQHCEQSNSTSGSQGNNLMGKQSQNRRLLYHSCPLPKL